MYLSQFFFTYKNIHIIIKKFHVQLYTNIFENLSKILKYLGENKIPKLAKKDESLNGQITL